jgi:cell wall-associated NlpC family hydrolase
MRGFALLLTSMSLLVVADTAHAQATAKTGGADPADPQQSSGAAPTESTGAAAYGYDPDAPPRILVAGTRAKRIRGGYAAAPAAAPPAVQEAIWAANELIGKPYRYGGGHTRNFKDTGYDCSGTVSFALRGGRLLRTPLDSSSFMSWGASGAGRWITVYTNPGHAYAVIAGLRLDTSGPGERGPRWRPEPRSSKGFVARHPRGL